MEILEAFDITRSYRAAAELVGCDHHTVAQYVGRRNQGRLSPGHAKPRRQLIEPYLPKIEEWVDTSRGKIRADVAHERLLPLGYLGSERTTRRAVAAAKKRYRAGHRRVYRPWVVEPGLWYLCGSPHKNHYVEPAIMWNRLRVRVLPSSERHRGVLIEST